MMREAFDIFYAKMNESWKRVRGTNPKVSLSGRYNKCGLIVTEKDEKGYAEWQPKLQERIVDFSPIEAELGFSIHPEIKAFLSTYYFLPLQGSVEGVDELCLMGVLPGIDMEMVVKDRFNKEEYHYLKDFEYFLLGDFCCINGDDGYTIHVNNTTGEVTAVQALDKVSVKIANSITELLMTMKGEWD